MIFDRLTPARNLMPRFDESKVLKRLGHSREKTDLSRPMESQLRMMTREAMPLIHPRGVHIMRKIRSREDGIRFINTPLRLPGRAIRNRLRKASAAVFLAVTIGGALEEALEESTRRGRLDQALILDAIGSEAVEAAADDLNSQLVVMSRLERHSLTRRFSPGYGDLPLEVQKPIYEELALGALDIRLTEKYLLFPQKTITAIIGVIS